MKGSFNQPAPSANSVARPRAVGRRWADRLPGRDRRPDVAQPVLHDGRRAVLPAGTGVQAREGSCRHEGLQPRPGAAGSARR